jgi:hypothetical protein
MREIPRSRGSLRTTILIDSVFARIDKAIVARPLRSFEPDFSRADVVQSQSRQFIPGGSANSSRTGVYLFYRERQTRLRDFSLSTVRGGSLLER